MALRDWRRAGVWQRLHQLLLDRDRNRQLDRWPALPAEVALGRWAHDVVPGGS